MRHTAFCILHAVSLRYTVFTSFTDVCQQLRHNKFLANDMSNLAEKKTNITGRSKNNGAAFGTGMLALIYKEDYVYLGRVNFTFFAQSTLAAIAENYALSLS